LGPDFFKDIKGPLPQVKLTPTGGVDLANTPDWIKAGNDAVMIPVGSVEKHGHHVPLGVDSHTTMGSVERAAKKAKVVYTPLMPFGHSPHHMGEVGWGTGSVSLDNSTKAVGSYSIKHTTSTADYLACCG
jgi:hypothetical protein